jgi:hypothetical protein
MNKNILTIIVILGSLCFMNSEVVYACTDYPPVVIFSNAIWQYKTVGQTVYFDASTSYDPDNESISWTWRLGKWNGVGYAYYGDPLYGPNPYRYFNYSEAGAYAVELTVSDARDSTTDYCYFVIVEVDLSIPSGSSSYVPAGGQRQIHLQFDPEPLHMGYAWFPLYNYVDLEMTDGYLENIARLCVSRPGCDGEYSGWLVYLYDDDYSQALDDYIDEDYHWYVKGKKASDSVGDVTVSLSYINPDYVTIDESDQYFTVFDANILPPNQYIPYGTGMTFNCQIRPVYWTPDAVYIQIFNASNNQKVYENACYGVYVSESNFNYYWNGMGNFGSYSGNYLPAGSYYAYIEVNKDYASYYTPFDSTHKFTVLKLDLKQVSFSGAKNLTIKKDNGSMDYSAPQWQDNSSPLNGTASDTGDHHYPVAYISSSSGSDSYMYADVRIIVQPSSEFSNTIIKAENTAGYTFTDNGYLSGTELRFNSTNKQCAKKFDVETVQYFHPLTLNWKVSIDGGTSWFNAGVSDINSVYVTWKSPTSGMTLYETPLMLGCKNANTKTTDTDIISGIWNDFTDWNVQRVDGCQMTYWINSPTNQSLSSMLAASDGDGSCIAWSQLLHWCMKSQGLGSSSQVYEITADKSVNPGADGFLVKDWKFDRHIRTGSDAIRDSNVVGDDDPITPTGVNKPCILPGNNGILNSIISGNDTYQDGLYNGTNYPYVTGYDTIDQNGVKGQGNNDPPGAFGNHFVCIINSSIYDPSYGIGPKTLTEHENEAIDGILGSIDGVYSGYRCKKDNDTITELKYQHDGTKE